MKSTYFIPLSQYLFCSCHRMFRLCHFEVGYIFRLYPISHSWNTLLLFQSLLVWFTAPLAIFWNEISWNLRHGPPKGSLCTILFAYSWDFLFPMPLSYPLSDNLVLLKSNQSSQFVCHFPTIRSAKANRRLFCLYHLLFFSTVSHFSYIFLNTFSSRGSRTIWIVYENISGVVWPTLALFVRENFWRYRTSGTNKHRQLGKMFWTASWILVFFDIIIPTLHTEDLILVR